MDRTVVKRTRRAEPNGEIVKSSKLIVLLMHVTVALVEALEDNNALCTGMSALCNTLGMCTVGI